MKASVLIQAAVLALWPGRASAQSSSEFYLNVTGGGYDGYGIGVFGHGGQIYVMVASPWPAPFTLTPEGYIQVYGYYTGAQAAGGVDGNAQGASAYPLGVVDPNGHDTTSWPRARCAAVSSLDGASKQLLCVGEQDTFTRLKICQGHDDYPYPYVTLGDGTGVAGCTDVVLHPVPTGGQ